VDIAHTGEVAARTGDHIIRYAILSVAHELFDRHHEGVVNGNVLTVQCLHARLLRVVPWDLTGRDRNDVPRLRQRLAERAVVRGDTQRERAAR